MGRIFGKKQHKGNWSSLPKSAKVKKKNRTSTYGGPHTENPISFSFPGLINRNLPPLYNHSDVRDAVSTWTLEMGIG